MAQIRSPLFSFCLSTLIATSLSATASAGSSFELGTLPQDASLSDSLEPTSNWKPEARAIIQLAKVSEKGTTEESVDVAVETRSDAGNETREIQYRPASEKEVTEAKEENRFYRFILSAEGSLVFQSNNDIAVPGGSGSRFDLSEVAPGPYAGFRVYLWWMITQNHSLRLLYAPLSVRTTFTPAEDILFDQVNFVAGQSVDALYKFNSYRLSYIYNFDPVGRFSFRVGFTAKIRDAAIELESGSGASARSGSTTDIGFVPLLNFGVRYQVTDALYVDLDADGSWAPQGRAIDAALKLGYQVHPNVALEAGYRTVEGGADVDQVYNFAWFNSVFFGVSARF